MITYDKSAFGLNLLFRVHGSAVYRSIFPGLLSVACLIFFRNSFYNSSYGDDGIKHPYAVGVLVASTTFLIVFRANQGYSRYWEAASAVHHMMSKWMDSTIHTAVFHMQSSHYEHIKPPSYHDHPELNQAFLTRARERERTTVAPRMSTLGDPKKGGLWNSDEKSGGKGKKGKALDDSFVRNRALRKSISVVEMQSQSVRSVMGKKKKGKGKGKLGQANKDQENERGVGTLTAFEDITDELSHLPKDTASGNKKAGHSFGFNKGGMDITEHNDANVPRTLQGYAKLDGNWSQLFDDGKATYFNPDQPDMFNCHKLPSFASYQGGRTPPLFLQELAHLASLMSAVALSTLRNDIDGSMSPLGLYQPGAPWPEVDSDLIENFSFHGPWYKALYFRIMYLLGTAKTAEERTRYNAARPLPVIGGVSDNEILFLQMARGPSAKTQLTWNWLSEFIIREHLAGSLGKVGPPIISRIIQFLSDGMIFYNHARKIMFIPFPFPHAQLSSLFILISIPSIAYLMQEYAENLVVGCILCFFSVACLSGIHEVARELENPFRNIPNELPVVTFQAQFNEALITMFAGYHPDHFFDAERYKPSVSERFGGIEVVSENDGSNSGGFSKLNTGSTEFGDIPLSSFNSISNVSVNVDGDNSFGADEKIALVDPSKSKPQQPGERAVTFNEVQLVRTPINEASSQQQLGQSQNTNASSVNTMTDEEKQLLYLQAKMAEYGKEIEQLRQAMYNQKNNNSTTNSDANTTSTSSSNDTSSTMSFNIEEKKNE